MSDYNNTRKVAFNLRILRYYPGTDLWFDIYNNNKHAINLASDAVEAFDFGIPYITDVELKSKVQQIRDRLTKVKQHPEPYVEFKAAYQEIRALAREDERLILTK